MARRFALVVVTPRVTCHVSRSSSSALIIHVTHHHVNHLTSATTNNNHHQQTDEGEEEDDDLSQHFTQEEQTSDDVTSVVGLLELVPIRQWYPRTSAIKFQVSEYLGTTFCLTFLLP